MTQKLQRVLSNPFLRENPFNKQNLSISYNSTSCNTSTTVNVSKSYETNKTDYQHLAAENQHSYSGMASVVGTGSAIKKTSNPFYRKNLLRASNVNDKNIEIFDVQLYRPTLPNHPTTPQTQPTNIIYKSLAYQPPLISHSSLKSIKDNKIYEPTHDKEKEKEKEKYKENMQVETGKFHNGHLVSPRFMSVKCLDGKDGFCSPNSQVDPRNSRNDIPSAEKSVGSCSKRSDQSRRFSVDVKSSKSGTAVKSSPNGKSEGKFSKNKPGETVIIRGTKYYRQPLSCIQL